jgi:hypothetical protein
MNKTLAAALGKVCYENPPERMVENYLKRTGEHIGRVGVNLEKLEGFDGFTLKELRERGKAHDQSKYQDDEKLPYIWITEFYKCKNAGEPFQYPPGAEKKTRQASGLHVSRNRHHPEAHEDCNRMTDMDILDMVCDWTAMSQELGQGGSAREWADRNVGTRWNFNDERKAYIYRVIDALDAAWGIAPE